MPSARRLVDRRAGQDDGVEAGGRAILEHGRSRPICLARRPYTTCRSATPASAGEVHDDPLRERPQQRGEQPRHGLQARHRADRTLCPVMPPTRLLFVCMGNICRSPTAEGVMRHLLREQGLEDEIEIDSAGTGGWHAGDPPDRRATAAARRRGIVLDGAARQVRPSDFEDYDLLLAADRENLADLRAIAPDEAARAKVRLLREFDPALATRDLDVPDPYYGGPGRLRGRARPRRGGLPRAARRGPVSLEAELGAAAGSPVAASRRVAGGSINEALRGRARRRPARVREDAPGRAGRASTRPRRRRSRGWPSPARCACPR